MGNIVYNIHVFRKWCFAVKSAKQLYAQFVPQENMLDTSFWTLKKSALKTSEFVWNRFEKSGTMFSFSLNFNCRKPRKQQKKRNKNVDRLRSVMTEKAARNKEIVDSILTESLRELETIGDYAVSEMDNQEKEIQKYITKVETIHEECTLSMMSENSDDFLSDIKSIRNISLNTIPTVSKAILTFSDGNLSRNMIKKQFGFLRKQTQ